jgi:peptide/nickel transport system permease protein
VALITIIGDEIVLLVNGAVVVETVFGWPGVGILTMQAIVERDLPLVVAAVVVTGTAVILVNLATDLAYAFFNPRVRYG